MQYRAGPACLGRPPPPPGPASVGDVSLCPDSSCTEKWVDLSEFCRAQGRGWPPAHASAHFPGAEEGLNSSVPVSFSAGRPMPPNIRKPPTPVARWGAHHCPPPMPVGGRGVHLARAIQLSWCWRGSMSRVTACRWAWPGGPWRRCLAGAGDIPAVLPAAAVEPVRRGQRPLQAAGAAHRAEGIYPRRHRCVCGGPAVHQHRGGGNAWNFGLYHDGSTKLPITVSLYPGTSGKIRKGR